MSRVKRIGLVAVGGQNWMGGANYIRNLARAAKAADPDIEVSYICGDAILKDWRDVEPRIEVPSQPNLLNRFLRTPHRPLARELQRRQIEFIYPLTYDNEYNLGLPLPIGRSLGCRWAGWVPDFQHRFLPHMFSAEAIEQRDEQIALLVEDAEKVVLSSESARADFSSFYPAVSSKGNVLTFGTFPEDSWFKDDEPQLPSDIPPRFFLVCNQFWQHKNHVVLFSALSLLRQRGLKVELVCTGKLEDYRDPGYISRLNELLDAGDLRSHVRVLGLISRDQQIALFRRALAVIQPSLFEGWSTVVEDARVLGKPALLSDIAVHREQNPPDSYFFSPRSAEELADLIAEKWNTLQPGPDLEREAVARQAALERIRTVGERFLEIAAP